MAIIVDLPGPMPTNDPEDVARRAAAAAAYSRTMEDSMTPEQKKFYQYTTLELKVVAGINEREVKRLNADYKACESWAKRNDGDSSSDCDCCCCSKKKSTKGSTERWWSRMFRDKNDVTWALWLLLIGVIMANIIVLVSEGRKYGIWAQSNDMSRAAYSSDWWFVYLPIPTPTHCWGLFSGLFKRM